LKVRDDEQSVMMCDGKRSVTNVEGDDRSRRREVTSATG